MATKKTKKLIREKVPHEILLLKKLSFCLDEKKPIKELIESVKAEKEIDREIYLYNSEMEDFSNEETFFVKNNYALLFEIRNLYHKRILLQKNYIKVIFSFLSKYNFNFEFHLLNAVTQITSSLDLKIENFCLGTTAWKFRLVEFLESKVLRLEKVNPQRYNLNISEDFKKLTVKQRLQLGHFIYNICEDLEFFVTIKGNKLNVQEKVRLSSKYDLLLFSGSYSNYVMPQLSRPADIDEKNVEDFYKSNDLTKTRLNDLIIPESTLNVLNYLQQTSFRLSFYSINMLKADIYQNYLNFSSNCTIALDYESAEDFITKKFPEADPKEKLLLEQRYQISLIKLKSFIDTMSVMILYAGKDIFFNCSLDWRGRVLYLGFPLNPQGSKIFRKYFGFGTENARGFDVTASGIQIMGLTLGCESLLTKTRFFEKETFDKDVYEDIVNNLKNLLDCQKEKDLITREFVKKLTIQKFFGSNSYSRIKEIKKELRLLYDSDLAYLRSLEVEKFYLESIAELIPSSNVIQTILEEVARAISKKGKTVILKTFNGYLQTSCSYFRKETVRTSVYTITERSKVRSRLSVQALVEPYKVDIKKTCSAITANFIQMIESSVLNRVVTLCKEENIDVFVCHDCFYVVESNSATLKRIYFESCRELFLTDRIENNPIAIFILANGLSLSEYKDVLEKAQNDLKSLFLKYKMHKDILK